MQTTHSQKQQLSARKKMSNANIVLGYLRTFAHLQKFTQTLNITGHSQVSMPTLGNKAAKSMESVIK